MRSHIYKIIIFLSCILLSGCNTLSNSSSGYDKNSQLNIREVWYASTGKGIGRSHVKLEAGTSDGVIYTADNAGFVTANDIRTGKEIWHINIDAPISSGPVFHNNVIVVGTSDAEVVAINANDASIKWRTQVSNEVLAAPTLADNKVFVKTTDGILYALNLENGKHIWEYKHGAPSLVLRGSSRAVVHNNILVVGFDDGKVLALSTDQGKLIWESVAATPDGDSLLERMVDIDADPLIDEGVVYIVTYQGNLTALSLTNGHTLWRYKMSSYTGLAIDDDQIYVTDTNSYLWALNKNSGIVNWKQTKLANQDISAPAVTKDMIVLGDKNGNLYWFAASDGNLIAMKNVGPNRIIAKPKVIASNIIVVTVGGKLAVFKS